MASTHVGSVGVKSYFRKSKSGRVVPVRQYHQDRKLLNELLRLNNLTRPPMSATPGSHDSQYPAGRNVPYLPATIIDHKKVARVAKVAGKKAARAEAKAAQPEPHIKTVTKAGYEVEPPPPPEHPKVTEAKQRLKDAGYKLKAKKPEPPKPKQAPKPKPSEALRTKRRTLAVASNKLRAATSKGLASEAAYRYVVPSGDDKGKEVIYRQNRQGSWDVYYRGQKVDTFTDQKMQGVLAKHKGKGFRKAVPAELKSLATRLDTPERRHPRIPSASIDPATMPAGWSAAERDSLVKKMKGLWKTDQLSVLEAMYDRAPAAVMALHGLEGGTDLNAENRRQGKGWITHARYLPPNQGGPLLQVDATAPSMDGAVGDWFAMYDSDYSFEQAVITHEFGHHAFENMAPDLKDEFISALAAMVGVQDLEAEYPEAKDLPDDFASYKEVWNHLLDETNVEPQSPEEYQALVDEVRRSLFFLENTDQLASLVSDYGTKSYHEFFAEAFAEYVTNPDARDVPKMFGSLLEEVMQYAVPETRGPGHGVPGAHAAGREGAKNRQDAGRGSGAGQGAGKGLEATAPVLATGLARALTSEGGFTLDVGKGEVPKHGYSVALAGSSSIQPARGEDAAMQQILDFINNPDRKSDVIGGWFDEQHGEICLDYVVIEPDREKAITLAKKNDQQAIFHLDNGDVIDTGGSGGRQEAGSASQGAGQLGSAVPAGAGGVRSGDGSGRTQGLQSGSRGKGQVKDATSTGTSTPGASSHVSKPKATKVPNPNPKTTVPPSTSVRKMSYARKEALIQLGDKIGREAPSNVGGLRQGGFLASAPKDPLPQVEFAPAVLAAMQPGDKIYRHPQGATIIDRDGSVVKYSKTGKPNPHTSSNSENLATGHGAWKHVANPKDGPVNPDAPKVAKSSGSVENVVIGPAEPEQKSAPAPGKTHTPMDFLEAPVADVPKYIKDPKWFFQQKVDGTRAQLVIEPGKKPWFRSKSGGQLKSGTATKVSDKILASLGEMPTGGPTYTVDGEVLNGKWYVFDMAVAGQESMPWEDRMAIAEQWTKTLNEAGVDMVDSLPTAKTAEEKQKLYDSVYANGGEGVMMKQKDAPYKYDSRVKTMLKAKFRSTADVVVVDKGRDGHDSATLAVYDKGKLVEIGSASLLGKQKTHTYNIGDVVEVSYLYAFPESQNIVQPVIMRPRPDKDPKNSSMDQLRFVSKEVLTKKKGFEAGAPIGTPDHLTRLEKRLAQLKSQSKTTERANDRLGLAVEHLRSLVT